MKRINLLLIFFLLCLVISYAQTPVKQNKSVVIKLTATWCGPCGSWGFPFTEQLIPALGDDAFFVSSYSSGYTSWMDTDFFCWAAQDWDKQLYWGALPAFSANFQDKSMGAQTSTDIAIGLFGVTDNFKKDPVVASTGFYYHIADSIITVKTKTRFWEDASGLYYLSVFILEDGVEHSQNGQTSQDSTVPHRFVLRDAITSSGWGDLIAQGSIKADQTFDTNYTYTVKNPTWDKSKLKVATILFKLTGTVYQYVNGWDVPSFGAGIKEDQFKEYLTAYPNPASDKINLTLHLDRSTTGSISILDLSGRSIYHMDHLVLNEGTSEIHVPLAGFNPGLYTALINTTAGSQSVRFTVIK